MAKTKSKPPAAKRKAPTPQPKRRKRSNSKQARAIAMLRTPEGATVAQLSKAFHWQPHTVRGFLAGALKKKLGLTIKSEKAEDGERVYRIA
jgi:hypothetical protein